MTTTLTPDRVEELIRTCLLTDEQSAQPDSVAIAGQGVLHQYAFSPERIEEHHEEIKDLLYALGPRFRAAQEDHPEYDGGWSFLNMCLDEAGHQWTGEHFVMEGLFALGIAAGWAKTVPKQYWTALPGGMPYLIVLNERVPVLERVTVAQLVEGADATSHEKDTVCVVTDRCVHCGKTGEVTMPKDAYQRWQAGEFIQHAWPEGSAGEREQLMNGTHPACFDEMFKDFD